MKQPQPDAPPPGPGAKHVSALRGLPLYGRLALGVASVSLGAIFIRLADTEPMTVAAYRMLIAAAVVAVPTLLTARRQLFALRRSDLSWLVLSGLFLAAHFASWITSLSLTSVASSVLLVTTTPLFAAFGSHFLLGDRVGKTMALAVALSLGGGAVLAVGDWDGGGRALLGDGLAVLGAIAVTGYYLVGRKLRGSVPILPYITVVYSAAALVLLLGATAASAPMLGLPWETYLWATMAALVPQVLGHSLLNWALAHITATVVSITVRAEPVIATLLAIPILDEVPPWTVVPGGLLLMAGVLMAVRSEGSGASPATPVPRSN